MPGGEIWRLRHQYFNILDNWFLKFGLSLFQLSGFGSAVPSLQLHAVFDAVSSRALPGNATSRFVGLGDKGWDNFKNSFRRGSVPHHHRVHVPQPDHQCLRAGLGARYGRIRCHAHARGREAHEGMRGMRRAAAASRSATWWRHGAAGTPFSSPPGSSSIT